MNTRNNTVKEAATMTLQSRLARWLVTLLVLLTAATAYGETVVTSSTTEMTTGTYRVTGDVTIETRITINGTVTLILDAGKTLTASKGIEVDEGNTLTIEGNGMLNATAEKFYAAIGRGYHDSTSGTSGTININGGSINATGGRFAAAIGGGYEGVSGTINISGGTIVATGGYCAAAIGGGTFAGCGVVNISGGQVTANGDRASGIGPGYDAGTSGTLTLGWTNEDDFIYATNYDNVETLTLDDEFYFVDNGEHIIATTTNIGGKTLYPLLAKNTLEYAHINGIEPYYRYTGNDIDVTYTVRDLEGNLMVEGTDYTAAFSPSTIKEKGDYTLTITAAGDHYTGSKSISFSVVDKITVLASTTEMDEKYGVPYTVSNDVTVDSRINIVGDILLVLGEGKTLTASKGIELSKNNKLTIEGNGSLTANGDGNNAGIGAMEVGTLIINSGNITATGGDGGSAGIGGSKTNYQGNTDGGVITINGGTINATGSAYTPAIGGSLGGVCGTITINGGKVTANGGSHYVAGSYEDGYGIGVGYNGTKSGTVILGWTNEDDIIYFSSINNVEEIRFAVGKNFYYTETDVNVVAATDNIEGKTLHPYLEKVDFENVTISGIQPYYPYTGNDINIEFNVFDAGGNKLTINEDYTAAFSRTPINSKGDYTLTVTATSGSNFTGAKSLTFHVVDYISVTGATTTMNSDYGLVYRVDDNVTVDERITISGDVTLILDEGKKLIASKGIELSAGNKLTIEGKGILEATGEDSKAGIGAREVGTLVINSNVAARGGNNAAGLGGSSNNTSGGTIIINGGEVVAQGGFCAAGIGGGLVGVCGTITINGGKVIAVGGDNGDLIYSGIGSGEQLYARKSGTVTLGWTNESDGILTTNYNDVETLRIADGKAFTASTGKVYIGTLDDDQRAEFAGKALKPALVLADDATNATAINDNNSITLAVQLTGRTLYTDGDWNTLCLPFALGNATADDGHHFDGTPLEGFSVKELDTKTDHDGHVTGLDGTTLYLNFRDATSITAGVPYIVKKNGTGDINNPVFSGVTISNIAPVSVGSTDGAVTFVGSYSPVGLLENDKTLLYLGAANTLYWPSDNMTIGSCRAVFHLGGSAQAKVQAFSLNFGDDLGSETGIKTIDSREFGSSNSTRTGIYTLDIWYSLDGRRLRDKPTVPGLYIVNGKKVVVK